MRSQRRCRSRLRPSPRSYQTMHCYGPEGVRPTTAGRIEQHPVRGRDRGTIVNSNIQRATKHKVTRVEMNVGASGTIPTHGHMDDAGCNDEVPGVDVEGAVHIVQEFERATGHDEVANERSNVGV